jgi:hypothetical protein
MSENLETELRKALLFRAESVPPETVQRLVSADYHPRTRTYRIRVAIGVGSAAVLAAVVTLVAGVFAPGVSSEFASWTPTPTRAHAGQVAPAEAACTEAVTSLARQPGTRNATSPFIEGSTDWKPVVVDERGAFTLVAFAASYGSVKNEATCLTGGSAWRAGPQLTLTSRNGSTIIQVGGVGRAVGSRVSGRGSSFASSSPATVGTVSGPTVDWVSSSNDEVALGEVGAGVTSVSLTLSNETVVATTVSNGYYAAWWPGYSPVRSTSFTTAQGTSTVTYPAP